MHTNRKNSQSGQALITSVIFFLVGSLVVLTGVSTPVLKDIRAATDLAESRKTFALSEGSAEEVTYRLLTGLQTSATESLIEGSISASTSVISISGGKQILSDGDSAFIRRKFDVRLLQGSGATFNYGLQADAGGFDIKNVATIRGNTFSNGPVIGQNANTIFGDVISAGPNGLVDGITATGTVWANSIDNSTIGGDAYYQSISGSSVSGTEFPGSANQGTTSLPISDSEIESWKQEAVDGGTLSCSDGDKHKIESSVTIGPGKYPCNLEVTGSPTVTLTGPIWVAGDITVKNTATFQIDSGLSGKTVQVIADVPANRSEQGVIELQNQAEFNGFGESSYILFISMNNSEEQGGDDEAIIVKNSVEGDLLVYAPHGRIEIQNSVSLNSATAYTIELENSAEVVYETGLVNLLFSSGPSGGFTIDSWAESK